MSGLDKKTLKVGSSGGNTHPGGIGGPTFSMPAAMPGQLEAIAAQLGMGYGQDAGGMLSHMNTLYKPMLLPDYSPGAMPPPAATPDKATTTAPKSTSGKRMVQVGTSNTFISPTPRR